jgi:hypothetical protein
MAATPFTAHMLGLGPHPGGVPLLGGLPLPHRPAPALAPAPAPMQLGRFQAGGGGPGYAQGGYDALGPLPGHSLGGYPPPPPPGYAVGVGTHGQPLQPPLQPPLPAAEPPSKVVMATNLPLSLSEEHIRELLSPFGPVSTMCMLHCITGYR